MMKSINFLRQEALNSCESKTYLYLNNRNKLIGFATISCSGIRHSYQTTLVTLPAIEIKYFAISNRLHSLLYDKDSKGEKEGEKDFTLSDCIFGDTISLCKRISDDIIGAKYIILYSVPKAVNFYTANMFQKFNEYMDEDHLRYLEGCQPMYIEIP